MAGKNGLFDLNWTLEPSESRFSTSAWSPSSETRLYEEVPGGYKLTVSGTAEKRGAYSWGYTTLYDGKEHPVHGRPDIDSIETYKVSDRITIGFFRRAGIEGGAYQRQVSADGRVLTVVASGID